MGADLYQHLKDYLKKHLDELKEQADQQMEEDLLTFYTREWKRYTTATMYVHHIFRYLNRHWVKREIDEGHKTVYDVYTVCLYKESITSWLDYILCISAVDVGDMERPFLRRRSRNCATESDGCCSEIDREAKEWRDH